MDAHFFNGSRQSHLRARKIENTFVRLAPPRTVLVAPEREAAAAEGLLSLTSKKRKREPTISSSPLTFQALSSPFGGLQTPSTDTESLSSDKQEEAAEGSVSLDKHQRRRSAAQPGLWDVVLEYFRVFRHGLQGRRQGGQVAFLRASMSLDVAFNTGRGTEAMLRSWKCFSLWFKDIKLELRELEEGPRDSLVATTVTSVTITERTLRNVFPHVRDGLAEKLLGQRLVMHGATRFEWDPVRCRVCSVVARSDLRTAMTRLLHSAEDAARVCGKALISPAFQWRLTST
jgi:hypothetical protein